MQIAVVTRVVDSMVHAPRPTRAEATDVANLVLDGADCILLGAETFRGMQPVTCAAMVRDICRQAETVYDSESFYNKLMDGNGGFRHANLSAVRTPLPAISYVLLSCFACSFELELHRSFCLDYIRHPSAGSWDGLSVAIALRLYFLFILYRG